MDELDLTLAAVIVAAFSGLAGIVMAVWTTKRNERMTRESLTANEKLTRETLAENERVTRQASIEDRRAHAYVEALRIASLRHLGVAESVNALRQLHRAEQNQVPMDPMPAQSAADWAHIGALLDAYSSPALRASYRRWNKAYSTFEVRARVIAKALSVDERLVLNEQLDSELEQLANAEDKAFSAMVATMKKELNGRTV